MKRTIDENVCRKIVFHALGERKKVQDLINDLADYADAHIVVVDIKGKVLAKSATQSDIPPLKEVMYRQQLQEVMNTRQASIVEHEHETISIDMIQIKNCIEGYGIIRLDNQNNKQLCEKIIEILCHTLSIALELDKTELHHQKKASMKQMLCQNLFEHKSSGFTKLEAWDEMYKSYLTPPYILVVIQFGMYNEFSILEMEKEIARELEKRSYTSYTYLKNQMIKILFTNINSDEKLLQLYDCIRYIQKKFEYVCGVSALFDNIDYLSDKVKTAKKLLDIGPKIQPQNTLYFETELYLHVICSYATEHIGNSIPMNKELNLLLEEDEEKGTDFYNTLKIYLLSGNSVSLASKQLYIHRNTMIYRLNKIGSILKKNINEPEIARTLIVSMVVKKLMEIS